MRAVLCWMSLCCALAAGARSCEQHEKCVALTACPSLRRLAATGAALAADDKARLRAAQCGWAPRDAAAPNETVPAVCCPLLPLDDCGAVYNQDKMIFSPIVRVFEAPWLARLAYRLENGSLETGCTASLVSSLFLVTAAHCVAPRAPVSVRLGDLDTETDPDCSETWHGLECAGPALDVAVGSVVVHPDYVAGDGARRSDLALVRLQRAVAFSNEVRPLCLPLGALRALLDGDETASRRAQQPVVHGWATQANNGSAHHLVRKGMQRLVPAHECAAKLGLPRVDAELQTCAVPRPRSSAACLGDPGGSLTAIFVAPRPAGGHLDAQETLLGVLSLGRQACANGSDEAVEAVPTVFSRVQAFVPWVLARLGDAGVVY